MGKHINTYLYGLLLATLTFSSCDDGRIYDEPIQVEREGGTVRLTAQLSGQDHWASGYSIVLAGFSDDSEYAKTAKGITSGHDGTVDITLTGIPNEVNQIEICAINRLRKRIVSFYTYDYTEQEDTIRINAGAINASMYNSIQTNVFDRSCTSCHGGSTSAAAGLYLTSGRSYDALINVIADKSDSGMYFVTPCQSEESFLHLVLNTDITANWSMDHIDMVTSHDLLQLIDDWIDNGANEN